MESFKCVERYLVVPDNNKDNKEKRSIKDRKWLVDIGENVNKNYSIKNQEDELFVKLYMTFIQNL